MTRLTTCLDADAVAVRAAALVRQTLSRAREERGTAHVALSGGTTPGRTYELLGAEPSDLQDVEIWFADERCVAPDDKDSNYLLVARTLLEPAAIPAGRVHRMQGELGPHDGALAYAHELSRGAPADDRGVPVIDVAILGIGPDGHIASLFPGAWTLRADESETCLGIEDSPKPPPERITLSLSVLRAARGCLLLATGAGKADAVSAMLSEPSRHVPASMLRRERLTVIVDDAAAPPGPRP
ncbi:MAG TPA: 6-phosphogluconolactonase [Solirubrobacteraceae bacterium]